MIKSLPLLAVLLAVAGCTGEEYTCVCTDLLTGEEIDRTSVSGDDVEEAAEECDDRESFTYPDRCVIVE